MANAQARFHYIGIFPINRNIIEDSHFMPASVTDKPMNRFSVNYQNECRRVRTSVLTDTSEKAQLPSVSEEKVLSKTVPKPKRKI